MIKNEISKVKLPYITRVKKRFGLVLKKKKQIIGLITLGLVIAAIISFFLPKYYQAIGTVVFKYQSVNNSYLTNSGSLAQQIEFLSNDTVISNTIDNLSQKGISITKSELRESQEILVDVTSVGIDVKISSDGAEKSASIANLLIENLMGACLENDRSHFLYAVQAISDREKELQATIQKGLTNQQSASISNLTLEQENLITQISEFESELESVEIDNLIYLNESKRLENIIVEYFPDINQEIIFINDDEIRNLSEQLERLGAIQILSALSQKLGGFEIQYLWPEEYNLNELSNIEIELKRKLDNYLLRNFDLEAFDANGLLQRLSEKILMTQIYLNSMDLTKSTIFYNITSLETRFNQIPFELIDDARKSRVKKYNNSLLIKIRTKKSRLIETERNYFPQIDFVKRAEVPKHYYSPNIILNLIYGGLLGLIIGFLYTFLSNSDNINFVESADDIEDYGYKLVSQVPTFKIGSPILFDSLVKTDEEKVDQQIIKSFENVVTFLKYGSLDQSLKTIFITSCEDGDGKSVISSNVAIALANEGNKVLLVDANFKHPILYKFFKIKSTPSLAHFLFRKKELNDIIRNTHHKNLDIITCIEFPQNPAVIITSGRMKNFMDQVQTNYDYIIYDTCSLKSLKETATVAKFIDEIILVVRANKTKFEVLSEYHSLLNEKGISDFDVILNDVKT